jgi:hypothetical protein
VDGLAVGDECSQLGPSRRTLATQEMLSTKALGTLLKISRNSWNKSTQA